MFFKIKMCDRKGCFNVYSHKPHVSDLNGIHKELCSYHCYLHVIGFYEGRAHVCPPLNRKKVVLCDRHDFKKLPLKSVELHYKPASVSIQVGNITSCA